MVRLQLEGDLRLIETVVNQIRRLPLFNLIFSAESEWGTGLGDEVKVVCYLEKDQNFSKYANLEIVTVDGQTLNIPLANCSVVDLGNQMKMIYGKVYDIFG